MWGAFHLSTMQYQQRQWIRDGDGGPHDTVLYICPIKVNKLLAKNQLIGCNFQD